jgi:hypothetical protein
LDWSTDGAVELVPGGPQLALNLAVLAAGALARGGRLAISCIERGAQGALQLVASGTGAKLADAVRSAAQGEDIPLDHNNIHAWYCHRLATRLGATIELVSSPDEVRLAVYIERRAA